MGFKDVFCEEGEDWISYDDDTADAIESKLTPEKLRSCWERALEMAKGFSDSGAAGVCGETIVDAAKRIYRMMVSQEEEFTGLEELKDQVSPEE
jgi:hypothetical protein